MGSEVLVWVVAASSVGCSERLATLFGAMMLVFPSVIVSILLSSSVEESSRSGSYILYACLIVGWVDLVKEVDFEEVGFVAFVISIAWDMLLFVCLS